MAIPVKNLFLDNPGQECTSKSLLYFFSFIIHLFKKSLTSNSGKKMLQDSSEPWDTVGNE